MYSPLNWFYKGKIKVTILVTFLIISIVPVLVALHSYYFTTRNALEFTAVKRLEDLAEWETKLVRDWFHQHVSTVRVLANSPEVKSMNWVQVQELLKRTKKHFPEFGSFAFVDNHGKIIYENAGNIGIDVSDRKYFKAAMKGADHISEMLIARTFKLPCIVISSPVKVDGKIVGLLYGTVTVETLNNVVMGYSIGETGESFLVDRQGNLITTPKTMRNSGLNPNIITPAPDSEYVMEGLKGKDGVIRFKDYRQVDILGVRKWLYDLEILVITKQDKSEAIEQAGGWGLQMSLVFANAIILSVFPVVWFLTRHISKPLEAITTAVNEVSSGNLSYRVEYIRANEEIELLGRQINDMSANLEQSMKLIGEQMSELEAQKEEIAAQNDDILKAYEQLTKANQNLERMATTDQLTEIFNRRYFMDRLRTEILITLRSRRPLAVALMDIDHFKSVNDTYGHKAGDQVLKGLVKVVGSVIRRSDLLARFGGEEFIILAPETNLEGGIILAEKIRSAVEGHDFEIDGGTIRITASIGVSELNDFSSSPQKNEDQLLLTADHYLYQAKHKGRNRVEGGTQINV